MAAPAVNRLLPLTLRTCGAQLVHSDFLVREIDGLVSPFTPKTLANFARASRPAAALFSVEKFQYRDLDTLRRCADAFRLVGTKTIVCGPFPSFYPETFLGEGGFDAVLLGEPEANLVAAVRALIDGEQPDLPGVMIDPAQRKRPVAVSDVDKLPSPLRFGSDLKNYYCNYPLPIPHKVRWGSMITTRGCGRGCLFCSPFDRITFASKVRPRAIDSVFDEAMSLTAMGANVLSLEDDDPTFSEGRVLELCDALKRVPARFVCHARVDELNERLLASLADAGCAMIKLGVESGCDAVIERLHKGKPDRWGQRAREVVRMASSKGIATCGLFIVGSPGETLADLEQTRALILDTPFDIVQFHFFSPYPGSRFARESNETLSATDAAALYHYDSATMDARRYAEITTEQAAAFIRKTLTGFALRPGFAAAHLARFGRFYLHNPDVLRRLAAGLRTGLLGQ